MNRLLVRLLVAFVTFSFGLILTSLFKPVVQRQRVVRVFVPHEQLVGLSAVDEAEILAIYRDYGPAQTRHDRAFFERIETEDFTLTVDDSKMSRAQDIKWMEEQPADIVYESKVDHLKVFGDLAVAHGSFEIRDGNGELRVCPFVDVWVKRDKGWQIQSTVSQ